MAKKGLKIPTDIGSTITPKENYTAPTQIGLGIGIVDAVADYANKVSDKVAVEEAENLGYKQQQKAIKEGKGYFPGGATWTLTGAARQKGRDKAVASAAEIDYRKKIRDSAEKYQTDTQSYISDVAEIKSDWLSELPTHLQKELSGGFDKFALLKENQVEAKRLQYEWQENTLKITDDIKENATTFAQSLVAQGEGAFDGGSEYMTKINANLKSLEEQYHLSPLQIREIDNYVRQVIITGWIASQYETMTTGMPTTTFQDGPVTRTTTLKDLWMKQVESGEWEMGIFGDEFGHLLPGGRKLRGDELGTFTTLVKSLDDKWYKETQNDRNEYISGLERENEIFTSGGGTEYNGALGKSILKFTQIDQEYMRTVLHFTEEEIATQVEKRNDALTIQSYVSQAVFSSNIGTTKIIADINTAKGEINSNTNLDFGTKQHRLRVLDQAEIRVNKEAEARLEHVTKGTLTSYYLEKSLVPADLSNADGNRKLMNDVCGTFNYPSSHCSVDGTQAGIELNSLTGITNAEALVVQAQNIYQRQKEFTGAFLTKALDGVKDHGAHAIKTVVDLSSTSEGRAAALELSDAFIKKDEYKLEAEKRLDATKNKTSFNDQLKLRFENQFGNAVDSTSSFGRSVEGTYKLIVYRHVSNGKMSWKDAIDAGEKFINNTFTRVKPKGLNAFLVPKNVGGGDFLADGRNVGSKVLELEKLAELMFEKPGDFNIILGNGETYEDYHANKSDYSVVYENGTVVLKNLKGFSATRIFQKLPSSPDTLFYSEQLMVSPSFAKKTNIGFTDSEPTWQFENKTSNWYSTFTKKWEPKKTKTIFVEPGSRVAAGKHTYEVDKDLDAWALDFMAYFLDTQRSISKEHPVHRTVTAIASGGQGEYLDSHSRNIIRNDGENAVLVANAISLAMKEGNIDDKMLQWLSQNAETNISTKLKNPEVRATMIEWWKEQGNEKLSKHQTLNDAPTIMTPLQVFFSHLYEVPLPLYYGDGDERMRGYPVYGNYGQGSNVDTSKKRRYR